jgi:hypothetical protein
MAFLWLLPPVVALLLLGAHFFRADNLAACAVAVLLIGLAFVRRPWAARVLQAALVVGALEWLRVAVGLAAARHAAGMPFLRLALILGAVCLFTGLAALVFRSVPLRARFGLAAANDDGPGRRPES